MPNFYNTAAWKKARLHVLSEQPLCTQCQAEGRIRLAQEVDHHRPLAEGGAPFDRDNLNPLCKSCHSKKTRRDNAKPGVGDDGVPLDPKHHWNQ